MRSTPNPSGPFRLSLKANYQSARRHGAAARTCETGRLIYLGTDPVEAELEVFHGEQRTIDFLSAHMAAFFTWGL